MMMMVVVVVIIANLYTALTVCQALFYGLCLNLPMHVSWHTVIIIIHQAVTEDKSKYVAHAHIGRKWQRGDFSSGGPCSRSRVLKPWAVHVQ